MDYRTDLFTNLQFIWNTNYPLFTNNGGFVDVYLFHQDTDTVATSWPALPNAQGRLSFNPGDSWWEGRPAADNYNGTDISWPFYFVITYAGQGLVGSTTRLSTWYAVQTALPSSIAASRSSASAASLASAASQASASAATLTGAAASSVLASDAAASSALQASLSSALVASLTAQGFTGTQTLQGTATATLGDGHIVTATATAQANGLPPFHDDRRTLPSFAIALIVVFGFLALVGAVVGLYFLLAAARRRRERGFGGDDENDSKVESRTPMMRGHLYSDGAASTVDIGEGHLEDATAARIEENSKQDVPFSSNQASLMADAFRAALRQPAFSREEDEGVGRSTDDSGGNASHTPDNEKGAELLREELKAEGHDLQSVADRKTPELHD